MDRDLSRSRAILIGNATYHHPEIPNLPAARTCVDAMAQLLTGELCGWPTDRVTTLVDLAAPHELASRVVDAIRDTEDVLLLYYVGHGLRTSEGQLSLSLGQTDPHYELRAHTGMLYENLARILRGCRAATKLVILDCCHAELGNKANYVFQSADLADAYPVDGLYFIGASAQDKKAKTPLDGSLTYFTDAFITVVNTGIPQRPAWLRLDQIFLELRARLVRANLPEPVESGTRGARQFPFARNAASPESHVDPESEVELLRRQLAEAQAAASRERPAQQTLPHQADTPHGPPAEADPEPSAAKAGSTPVPPAGIDPLTQPIPIQPTTITGFPQKPPYRPAHPNTAGFVDLLLDGSATTKRGPGLSRRGLLAAATGLAATGLATGGAIAAWIITHPSQPTGNLQPTGNPQRTGTPPPAATALGQPITGHTAGVNSVAFSPSPEPILASGSDDHTVRLWNVADPTHPTALGPPLTGHTGPVQSVAFSPDGGTLASGSIGDAVRLWNVTDPAHPTALGQTPTIVVNLSASVAFSPDGRTLASGSIQNTVLWDVTDPTHPTALGQTPTEETPTGNIEAALSVAFSPDGRTLASGNLDSIVLFNVADPSRATALDQIPTGHNVKDTESVAFSLVGHILANTDGYTIQLWDVTDPAHATALGQPIQPIPKLDGASLPPSITQGLISTATVHSVAFSPDGHVLASGSDDFAVRLFNVADPAHATALGGPLAGHTGQVFSVAFSPDGHTLASGSFDHTIRLWAVQAH